MSKNPIMISNSVEEEISSHSASSSPSKEVSKVTEKRRSIDIKPDQNTEKNTGPEKIPLNVLESQRLPVESKNEKSPGEDIEKTLPYQNSTDDVAINHPETRESKKYQENFTFERPSALSPPSEFQSDPEDSELSIVGSATAAIEILNEQPADLPTKDPTKAEYEVAKWTEQQTKSQESKNTVSIAPKDSNSNQQPPRKSQRIVTNIIKRSIKCLNKMHAIDNATTSPGNGKSTSDKKDEDASAEDLPKVPHNRQNGAALPEETTTVASVTRVKHLLVTGASIKKENHSDCDDVVQVRKKKPSASGNSSVGGSHTKDIIRKRRSTEDNAFSTNGNPKRICFEQRERFIDSLVGSERVGADELATRADELRAEVQALDELARAKEMEWNEILSMRKLKEEAYLRVERRRQVMGFLESNNGQMADCLPPASLSLHPEWEQMQNDMSQERPSAQESSDGPEVMVDNRLISRSRVDSGREDSPTAEDEIVKRDDESMNSIIKSQRIRSGSSAKHIEDSLRKQRCSVEQNLDQRHIGEGRQGPIVDVKSIIADYRLRHPETVPRRGRRMRNSVNIGLGAGGAMVETGHGQDSRASSTDSCKSNPINPTDAMSFKDVLVQFAKLSQQQGEPVKTPQNYPDVTLHPVAPSPVISTNSSASQQPTGSLLHGILTKSQSPRPATFSPTLARLLTAPERDRNTPPTSLSGQQAAQAQHLLQTYQGSNPVSISDLLSSSKARTEITITPVVNPSVQSTHSNNTVHIDEAEEENSLIEERDTRRSGRDNREDRDSPPRCQGCHERAAQFVCAGCGNQWYCSRECQVSAWDEHSEVCSG